MRNDPILINSGLAGFANPVTWHTEPIDLGALGGVGASFHIYWQDVGLTFYLWSGNASQQGVTSPPWHDDTAAYRALDPLWVDPVVGDPASEHLVRFINLGARYVILGYTAGNWGGVVNPFLQIVFFRTRVIK